MPKIQTKTTSKANTVIVENNVIIFLFIFNFLLKYTYLSYYIYYTTNNLSSQVKMSIHVAIFKYFFTNKKKTKFVKFSLQLSHMEKAFDSLGEPFFYMVHQVIYMYKT